MLRNLPKILSLGLLVAIGLGVSYFATHSYSSAAAHPGETAGDPVKEITGYRGWTKVNTEPQLMPDQTAALCAPASPALSTATQNPHRNKYITVYVNELGRKAMLEQKSPAFPEGSIIVKEKLQDKSSPAPELMTVMIKRGKGFNPTSGDWEYMVVDGTGTKVMARGKLDNCQSCHRGKPGTDYVFRTYLPGEVSSTLK
jgi:Cytochrome P460